MIPGCELDSKVFSSSIMDDFLKLYESNENWKDIPMNYDEPTKMYLHISFEQLKEKEP